MKEKLKNKKVIVIGGIIILICMIIAYVVYEDQRKKEIIASMNISFNEVTDVEYGTKDYDIQKELIKEVMNAEIKEIPSIDTTLIGEQALKFVLVKEDLTKEIEFKVNVVDTQKPEIKIKEDNIELTVGDEFDINSNIESITDKVDGEIKINKDAKDINKKATEKYNKLSDEEKTKVDTVLVDKLKISDFKIEDIKDKKEKNLYLKNCYFIDGSVDTSKAEEYTIKVFAIDKNGLNSEKEFKVTVKEPVKEETPVSANVNSSNGSGSGTWAETTPNDANQSAIPQEPVVTQGSVWDVIATAQAQLGKPYVTGGRGPDSFDCDGLVMYAYAQNGYSFNGSLYAGYSIGNNLANARPGDIIIMPNHAALVIGDPKYDEGMQLYRVPVIEAMNPQSGVIRNGINAMENGYSPLEGRQSILDIRRVI